MREDSRKNPRPTRIPEQKQITPEMEERQRQRAIAKEARFRKLFVYRMVGLAVLVVGVPLAIILYATRAKPKLERDEQALAMTGLVDTLERDLADGDVDRLIDRYQNLEADVYSGEVAQQVNAIRARSRIAEKLINLNRDETTTNFAIKAKIDALLSLSSFDVAYKTQNNTTMELLEYASAQLDDGNPAVRNKAKIGILTSHVHNYLKDNTDQNFQKVIDEVPRFFDELNPDAEVAQALVGIGSLLKLSSREDQVEQFNLMFAAQLLDNPDPQLQQIGSDIMDKSILGAVNFLELRQLILIPDRDSINRLEAIVADISKDPNVSPTTFQNTLDTVEMLGRVDEDALKNRLVANLRGTIPRIAKDDARQEIAQIVSAYDVRQNLPGTTFEPLRNLADDEVADRGQPITLVLYYSSLSDLSREVVSSLKNLDLEEEVRFVVVCVDSAIGPNEAAAFQQIFPSGILVKPGENADFLRDCPVSTVPYMLLIDRDLKVVAVNVGVDQLRAKIEKPASR